MKLQLTCGKFAIIDRRDLARLRNYTWRSVCKGRNLWYAKAHVRGGSRKNRRAVYMHQVIHGRLNADHINGNGLDNRRSNLRSATRSQNLGNMKTPRSNTSGFKGVWKPKDSKNWRAKICACRVQMPLGAYATRFEAATAYGLAALLYFGEFARVE